MSGSNGTLAKALAYRQANLSVIPVRRDGTKAPACRWEPYQEEPASEAQVRSWFRGDNPPGIGVIGGDVSGGLECIDFDAEADSIFPAWCELVKAEAPGLVARLSVARTPKPGYHVRYRVPDIGIPGNTKLATDPAAVPDERCLIETRGEGGYAIAPGSPPDVHETGRPYVHHSGPELENVQPIGFAERDILIRCARSFDRSAPPEPGKQGAERGPGLSPGDDYDQRGPDWPALLETHGWEAVHRRGEVVYWRRPGKHAPGWSATTGACTSKAGRELLYVFSSNAAPFEPERGYSKFAVYTLLNHGGDFGAAAKALAEEGYGEQRRKPSSNGTAGGKPGDGRQDGRGRQSETSGAKAGSQTRKRIRSLPPYVPFPVEALPPIVKDYAIAAAEAIGCDVALVALPLLATVAGAIGNSRVVLLKKGWTEPAVLWTLTVAESGGHKSPGYHAAVNPMMELQIDKAEEYKAAVERYNAESLTWAEASKGERGEKPEPPRKPPSHVTGDVTIETLGELLRDAPRGLLVARDELDGWFSSFTRYKGKGGGSDQAGWLELHRAGTLIVDRLTRDRGSLMVRRACASVTGTIQPSTLAHALDQDALQAGLGARFLMAMPPRHRRVWTERELPDDLAERYQRLLTELLALPMRNPTKREPYVLGLSNVAKAEWVRFFNEFGRAQHSAEGEQAAALAKLEAGAARLALVHHVVSHVASGTDDTKSIIQGSMQAGITLARWFANEATRVYMMLHEDETSRRTRRLLEWITAHGDPIPGHPELRGVTVKDLQRSNSRRWPTSETAEAELDGLVSDGLGRWVEDAPRPGGGRRKKWFVVSEIASDVSDDCSDAGKPGRQPPSDDCSDDCRGDAGPVGANHSTSASGNGTYRPDAGEADKQRSETSDANSATPA